MRRSRTPHRVLAGALSIVAVGLTVAGSAEGGPPDDGVPSGTVAFFAGGTCPPGWVVATKAQGRLVVAVTDGASVGVQVGTPLADQEDRAHAHAYRATVALPAKGLTALNGPNNQGAAAQAYDVTGTTASATTGLPFIQVQACAKP